MDLRRRIAAALRSGETTRATAKRFGVSVATAVRVGQKWRSGKGLEPGKMGGHRRPVIEGVTAAWIAARLSEKSDLTVRALTAELAENGMVVCPDTVWRHLRREGLSFKKNADGERAGWRTDSAQAGAVENASASPGSEPAGLRR
jgi:transposase